MLRLIVTVLGLLTGSLAYAVESACHRPGASHSEITRGAKPLAVHADRLLKEDLDAAASMDDPLRAIARMQRQLYSMQHPEIEGNFGWYGTIRCGSQSSYQALQDAIADRVAKLEAEYARQQWYIGNTRIDRLIEPNDNLRFEQRPGLLQLLLMANRYEAFERHATRFLRGAVDDRSADSWFKQTAQLAESRVRELQQWDQRFDVRGGKSLVGLLAEERAGLAALNGFRERIDQLRDVHVKYWLGKEAATFADLKPLSSMLMAIVRLEDQIAPEQLSNAVKVARAAQIPELRALAEDRGDALMRMERFELAKRYYELSENEAKVEVADNTARDRGAAQAAKVEQAARKAMEGMQKTDAETRAFEDETDDLASELGIDLDDF